MSTSLLTTAAPHAGPAPAAGRKPSARAVAATQAGPEALAAGARSAGLRKGGGGPTQGPEPATDFAHALAQQLAAPPLQPEAPAAPAGVSPASCAPTSCAPASTSEPGRDGPDTGWLRPFASAGQAGQSTRAPAMPGTGDPPTSLREGVQAQAAARPHAGEGALAPPREEWAATASFTAAQASASAGPLRRSVTTAPTPAAGEAHAAAQGRTGTAEIHTQAVALYAHPRAEAAAAVETAGRAGPPEAAQASAAAAAAAAPPAAPPSPSASALPTSPQGTANHSAHLTPPSGSLAWQQALGQQLVFMAQAGLHSAQLQLHPLDLGALDVRLQWVEGELRAQFHAEAAAVREVVEAALPQLRTALGEQGLHLAQAQVGTGERHGPTQQDQGDRPPSGRARAEPAAQATTPPHGQAAAQVHFLPPAPGRLHTWA